jgi:ubiquinol-cytochrome c reductase cytochrome b subunit
MSLAFYLVLWISGGNDVIADKFDISLNAMTWAGRIGLVVLPPIVYFVTYRICLGLERQDREVLDHGIETGVIRRLPSGEFIEVHQPLGPVDVHGHGRLAYGGAPVPKKMSQVGGARRAIRGFFTPIEEPSAVELEQQHEGYGLAAAEEEERELTTSGRPSDGGRPSDDGRPPQPHRRRGRRLLLAPLKRGKRLWGTIAAVSAATSDAAYDRTDGPTDGPLG